MNFIDKCIIYCPERRLLLDRSKKDHSCQRITGDKQIHSHYDEKALVHGHKNSLHQHLQSGMFTRNRKEPEKNCEIDIFQ